MSARDIEAEVDKPGSRTKDSCNTTNSGIRDTTYIIRHLAKKKRRDLIT
jgi:hypothetical protein